MNALLVLSALLVPATPAEPALIQGKPLSYWIDQLAATEVLAREEGLEVLMQAGAGAKPALPAVRGLLKDQPLTVRFRAALTLWKIGGEADAIVPLLADVLADSNHSLRLRAVQTVGQLGPRATAAAPGLVQRLNDKDTVFRAQVSGALEQLGTAAIPALIQGAEAGSAVRRESINALARLGTKAKDAVPALTAALKDDDPKTRTAAAAALWQIDRNNTAILPVLLDGFKSNDPEMRTQAGNILFAIKPRPKEAAALFVEALQGTDLVTRVRAAEAVWDLDGKPEQVLPTLTEAVKSNILNVRSLALETLRRMGPKAKPILPVLVELLATPGLTSVQFCEAFAALGPDALAAAAQAVAEKPAAVKQAGATVLSLAGPEAVEPLRKLADHNEVLVRQYAVLALGNIGPSAPDKVLPVLAEKLKDQDPRVRLQTLLAYRTVGPEAGDAPAAIVELLNDKDARLRTNTLSALERMRFDAKTALPLLEEMAAKDDSVSNRVRALELCWRLDPKKHPVAEVVKEQVKLNQQARAIDFVARSGADGREAIPLLVEMLPTQQPAPRQKIIDILATFGPDAKAARPALVAQLKDPQAAIRVNAALALIQTGDAESALPILIASLKENSLSLAFHERIHAALRKLGPDARTVLPALRQIIAEPNIAVYRVHSALTLAKLDPDQKDAASAALLDILGRATSSRPMYFDAAAALLELDPSERRALSVLEENLLDGTLYNRQLAARHLARLGPTAKAALPSLRRAAEDESPQVRFLAAAAWWKVDGKNAKALAIITDTIKDPTTSADVRIQAISALAELGADGKDAVPVLLEALRDRIPTVRLVAEAALKKVDPEAARKAGY